MTRQITLIDIEKSNEKNLDSDIQWVCDCFGLSSGRDIENVSIRIIQDLLNRTPYEDNISSEMIANDLNINISRVNHHIRNLIQAGLVYRKKRHIYLRGGSLKSAVQEIRKDSERIFDELENVAEEIDQMMGLKNR
ncbi:conserved hypothetical protein [Methanosalsum zhilinae DSM 4017]|uniref:Uncharacterized protein n=1 Tax=Methanosalsum zhilinae (strain DSM 4017 / NBRC 107636 / OCM 62 / WeN5) TaxID=679901 RepID=F7XMZ0_METZD|nr:hypothetical protein [Methanosalsum zhilinae]AEH61099.1 conserved hypothetical protein [Methanosalsum zhilinae DSM 4017]